MRAAAGVVAAVLVLWVWSRAVEVGSHWQHSAATPAEVLRVLGAVVLAALLSWYAVRPRGSR